MVTPASWYRGLPAMSRRNRRIAVLAAFGGYPLLILGYATLVAPGTLSTTIWAPVAVALFATTLVGVAAVYGWGRGRMDGRLDERQRSMVDRALVLAYGAATTVTVLALGALAVVLSFRGPVTITMTELTPIIIAVALYLPVLPLAALAWIEPDAPADDVEAP